MKTEHYNYLSDNPFEVDSQLETQRLDVRRELSTMNKKKFEPVRIRRQIQRE
jgi:hypothetical protein